MLSQFQRGLEKVHYKNKREIVSVVELHKQQTDAKEMPLVITIVSVGILSCISLQTKMNLLEGMSLLHIRLSQGGSLGKLKLIIMTLTLLDQSIKYPYGVLEDILFRVDGLLFPVDFVILDMPEDAETPLILGKTFLETCRALIDVK